jgi:hypothetical protein
MNSTCWINRIYDDWIYIKVTKTRNRSLVQWCYQNILSFKSCKTTVRGRLTVRRFRITNFFINNINKNFQASPVCGYTLRNINNFIKECMHACKTVSSYYTCRRWWHNCRRTHNDSYKNRYIYLVSIYSYHFKENDCLCHTISNRICDPSWEKMRYRNISENGLTDRSLDCEQSLYFPSFYCFPD